MNHELLKPTKNLSKSLRNKKNAKQNIINEFTPTYHQMQFKYTVFFWVT